jgi:hypothetical protein
MLSRSIFRYFTCTESLRSSSKLRTSDSTAAWFVVELSGGRARERRRGEMQMPLDEARVQGKIKTRKSKSGKSGNQMRACRRQTRAATMVRGCRVRSKDNFTEMWSSALR